MKTYDVTYYIDDENGNDRESHEIVTAESKAVAEYMVADAHDNAYGFWAIEI